jgi:hypothetical protein
MADLDLDEVRAARAEQEPDPGHTVKLLGRVWRLPARLPRAVTDAALSADGFDFDNEADIERAARLSGMVARSLLGDQYPDFLEAGATEEDILFLVEQVVKKVYGVDPGEASASSGSSSSTSGRSRRTSNGSTGSTSARRSSVKSRSRRAASGTS